MPATVSGTSTAPVLTVPNAEDVVISQNGTNLTFSANGGAETPFGGALGSLTSLRITCSSSSSSSGNDIDLNLTVADGFSSSFRVTVTANGGPDSIDASDYDVPVSINGGSGDDTLIGGSGDDDLDGGSGNDNLSGGAGDDLCLGGVGNDTISGGDDHDIVNGMAGNDSLNGDFGNDYIYGGAGNDTCDGGDGGGGANVVKGQGGKDQIVGTRADANNELNAFRALDSADVFRDLTDPSSANLDPRDRDDEYGF